MLLFSTPGRITNPRMLTDAQRRFLDAQRVARFASADEHARPHVVPVCFCVIGDSAYFSIDEKPKRSPGGRLKRLRNVSANPQAALVADRYDEDWGQLGWVMLQGETDVLDDGEEHAMAQAHLKDRYVQLRPMHLANKPVVAIRIQHVSSWGNLEVS